MDRRVELLNILRASKDPVQGSQLAERLRVSRQTVVQDIAWLRKDGHAILSTTNGYLFEGGTKPSYREVLGIIHTPEQLQRELEILIAHQVAIEDVFIIHPVYGRIDGQLNIVTPIDLANFLEKRARSKVPLFSEVTGGLHYHTLVAENADRIVQAKKDLQEEGFQLVDPA